METTELNSKALREAMLRSDRVRIITILIVLSLLFVFTVARRLVVEGIDGARGLGIFTLLFGTMIAYEVVTLRRVTRALAEGTEPHPARWIGNVVVEALFPTIGLGVLIALGMTGPYAALEPAEGRLELLSAGHGPLMLYTASDDQVQGFEAHGIPFGIVPSMPYGPAQTIRLAPGDLLVLLTDGFFEWENAKEEDFGIPRLQDAIRAARHLPASQIISSLHDAVVRFAGGTRQLDDLTALVVKRLA